MSEQASTRQFTESKTSSELSKIVYFDEGSATDLIQLFHGGGLKSTLELFEADEEGGNAEIKAEGKIGLGKILQGIMGIGASVEGDSAVSISYGSNQVAKNILTNTVLTDFLACIDIDASGIERLDGYEISTITNTMSSMMLITPYLTMLRSRKAVRAGDFDVSVERADDAIRKAKGYYEFLAKREDSDPIILRFNHGAFKNNYKLPDLLKMRLVIYAVNVGEASPLSLDIESELDFSSSNTEKNPSYPIPDYNDWKQVDDGSTSQESEAYAMFDVILAGVKGNA